MYNDHKVHMATHGVDFNIVDIKFECSNRSPSVFTPTCKFKVTKEAKLHRGPKKELCT